MSDVLWAPSPERAAGTRLAAFAGAAPTTPEAYAALHRWSVDDLEGFWAKVWEECGVTPVTSYDAVHTGLLMPGTRWFPGSELNLAAHLLRRRDDAVAVYAAAEGRDDVTLSWRDLAAQVARAQRGLAGLGVGRGHVVAGVVANVPETLVLAVATAALGATWTSCSPDFGAQGVVDRFRQVAPRVLVTVDGYRYGGRTHPLADKVAGVLAAMDVGHVVVVELAGTPLGLDRDVVSYDDLLGPDAGRGDVAEPAFETLPFDHPLYVLYSSGTTGVPKSIVHGHGGTLVTHLKEHQLHCDVGEGSTVQWFTTCGWMMWNWLVSALASGAAVVLYDGSPTHPDPGALWRLAERAGVTHFGTSPKFLAACQAAGTRPRDEVDTAGLRAVLSTGSPLAPAQFDWVYDAVADDVHLASVSGGTDLIACFAGGVPTLPVRRGRLQARALGMAVEAYDLTGSPVLGERGELVCTRPFPSMPVGFWGDDDGSRYHEAYFAQYPGVWAHGDFVDVDADGSVAIHGRSDTTLNPGGVRIGTAEIYRAIEGMAEVADSVVVGRPVDGDEAGDVEVVLCVVCVPGVVLDDGLVGRVKAAVRTATTPRHVPAHVFAVDDVPYTISGKKVEKAVRSMIVGEEVGNRDALANPDALDAFARLPFP